ncbi:PAS domain S-box protein [Massilia sp. DD77]|uniref:PAS domain S-box protein n=1 Tax=Massilia sp. DD77 TaxID=3109349 RepID=UPI002FFD9201
MPPSSPENLFSAAFSHSQVGMALVGLRGHWLEVNPSLCRILGYSRGELLATTFQELTHPEDLDGDLSLMHRVLGGELDTYTMEKRYRRVDGRVVWAQLTVSVTRDEDGQPECFIAQVIDISAQKAALEDRDAFFMLSPDLLAIADTKGYLLQVNPSWTDALGWTAEDLTSRPFLDFVHPDDVESTLAEAQAVNAGGLTTGFCNRYRHAAGGYRWLEWSTRSVSSGRLYCTVRDVTAFVENAEALRSQEEKIRLLLEQANDAFLGMDEHGVITEWNKQAELTFGWKAEEAIGQPMIELIAPPHLRQRHLDGMAAFLAAGEGRPHTKRVEVPALRRDGQEILIEVSVGMLAHRGQRYFYAFLRDVSEPRRLAEQMHYQATHDFLTGLPNRYAFMERLQHAIDAAQRQPNSLALLFIDLDGFKSVNDVCGHEAGDAVLIDFGRRLTGAVRRTDMVARLAGDEFVVMLDQAGDARADIEQITRKILVAAAAPYPAASGCAALGASIGVAFHTAGDSADALLSRADTAMYAAKKAGKHQAAILLGDDRVIYCRVT